MAAALATCDMATVIEGVRDARGWSQGELARAIDYSQSWVSRVVNGQQSLTVRQVGELARRLDIPLHLLRFSGIPPQEGPAPTGSGITKGVDITKRRDFGKAVAASALLPPAGRVAPTRERLTVNEWTAPALRAVTGGQRRMEVFSPSRHLLPGAMAHVHLAEQMLVNGHGTPFHTELSAAAGEASGFAAWLCADQGDTGSARAHYRTAVTHARRAGMHLLDVYMLGSLAAFETDTAEDPELGLNLVQEAEHLLGESAHPTALAWLACTGAMAHARLGDRRAAAQAIGRAEREVGRSGNTAPPWPWVFAFDEAKLAGYRALMGVRLGLPGDALRAFAEAVTPRSTGAKQAALLQVELASTYADTGDVDEAFRLAGEALDTGRYFGSERIVTRVRSFRHRYRGSRAHFVDELDQRLSSLASALPTSG